MLDPVAEMDFRGLEMAGCLALELSAADCLDQFPQVLDQDLHFGPCWNLVSLGPLMPRCRLVTAGQRDLVLQSASAHFWDLHS